MVSFVPLLMFAILFGLLIDYQVFLVGRIDERYHELDDNHEAVVEGLAASAKVITAAAAAIAVDATIVRCLLVPSVMVLFGRANWWLPAWLDRILPPLGLESEDKLPPLPESNTAPARASD
ncbi:MAG: MMPL family transporter [Solirubrobacterales bacterium]